MKFKIALRTLSLLATWLVLQNFNVTVPDNGRGKSMETPRVAAHPTSGVEVPISYKIKKVVLDAGHGGKDPGCKGVISKEKDNALAIVLKLGEMISGAFPEVEVIYTRKTDEFIELNERAAIANRNKADLFISVHCNAVKAAHIHGAETYVMGLHTADHNLEVAKRENAAIYYEENYQKNYEGYDPNSPEAHILGSVWQSAYLEQSILFASLVQQFANSTASRIDKGVKQAGFLVLRETSMPAVLVETGFLTNRTEEEFVASEEGQAQLAQAIFEAFEAYKQQVEGAVAEQQKQKNDNKTSTSKNTAAAAKTNNPTQKNTGGQASVPPAQKPSLPSATPQKQTNTPPSTTAASTKSAPAKTQPNKQQGVAVAVAEPIGPFRILLLTWPMRMDKSTGQMALLGDVVEEKIGDTYHYFTGKYPTLTEAEKMLPEIKNLGFRTASIVPAK